MVVISLGQSLALCGLLEKGTWQYSSGTLVMWQYWTKSKIFWERAFYYLLGDVAAMSVYISIVAELVRLPN